MINMFIAFHIYLGSILHGPPIKEDIVSQQKQFDCLTANVWNESRGETEKGMLFVAKTTLNRAHSERFPHDICKVVFQKSQFSWTNNKKNIKIKPKNVIEEKTFKKIVLLSSVAVLLDKVGYDFTGNSKYYHTLKVKPVWRKKLKKTYVVGNHVFYTKQEKV